MVYCPGSLRRIFVNATIITSQNTMQELPTTKRYMIQLSAPRVLTIIEAKRKEEFISSPNSVYCSLEYVSLFPVLTVEKELRVLEMWYHTHQDKCQYEVGPYGSSLKISICRSSLQTLSQLVSREWLCYSCPNFGQSVGQDSSS